MSDTVHRELKIVNEKGLHARASAKLVEVVEGFDARADQRIAAIITARQRAQKRARSRARQNAGAGVVAGHIAVLVGGGAGRSQAQGHDSRDQRTKHHNSLP